MSAAVKLLELEQQMAVALREVIAERNRLDHEARESLRKAEEMEGLISAQRKELNRLSNEAAAFHDFFAGIEDFRVNRRERPGHARTAWQGVDEGEIGLTLRGRGHQVARWQDLCEAFAFGGRLRREVRGL